MSVYLRKTPKYHEVLQRKMLGTLCYNMLIPFLCTKFVSRSFFIVTYHVRGMREGNVFSRVYYSVDGGEGKRGRVGP